MKKKATGYGLRATAAEKAGAGSAARRWQAGRWLGLIPAIALLCSGCGSFFESELPPTTRYVIAPLPPAPQPTSSAASQVDLSIGRPDVAPGLDTERVAVLRGRELDYFRGVQWSGRVAELTQAFLIGSLQDQKLFRSVTAEQTRVSSEYLLDMEIRDFQAEYATGKAAPEVRVTFIGRLIRISDRQMLETISATATRPATENRMGAIAAAFEAAAQQVALELSRESAAAIAKDLEQAK